MKTTTLLTFILLLYAAAVSAQCSVSITSSTNVSCKTGFDGSATALASNGTAPYNYIWSMAQTLATATGLGAGTYCVTITDNVGCTATDCVTITQPATALTASAAVASNYNGSNTSCPSSTDGCVRVIPAGGTPVYAFLWNAGGSFNDTICNLGAGTYTVTVTDANGCTATANATITNPPALTASIVAQTNVGCTGATTGSATVAASGGTFPPYTYLWNTIPNQTTATVTGLAAGHYCVTVADANNCTATNCVTITHPAAALTINTSNTPISCFGGNNGTATTSVSGGTGAYSYMWSGGRTTPNITGLTAGTYCVTVTDANLCTATGCITISEPSEITTTLNTTNISCLGGSDGSITATASGGVGGYTYLWYKNGIPIAPSVTTPIITGLGVGTYYVIVTDLNGCMVASPSAIITQPAAALTANANITSLYNGPNVSCFGANDGVATAFVSGGTGAVTYLWGPSTGNVTLATATGLSAGIHCVTATDANGCEDSACVTLIEPIQVSASIFSSSNPSCNGNFDGTAMAVGSGGTAAYTYQWNGATGGQTTATAVNLGANVLYCITVTDANGCSDSACVTLTQPSAVSVSIPSSTNISCFGGYDGSATALASGGTAPYTYWWSHASIGTVQTFLGVGTYCVTVTDNNGCTASTCVTLTGPTELQSNVITLVCPMTSDEIRFSPTGGVSPYQYSIDNGATNSTTSTYTGLIDGIYNTIVTDANGCMARDTISVDSLPHTPGILTTSGSGCTPYILTTIPCAGCEYVWNGTNMAADTTQQFTHQVIGGGTYSVQIILPSGCITGYDSIILSTPPPSIAASISSSTNIYCNGGTNGSATVVATNASGAATYLWSDANGQTTATATGLAAGAYFVQVNDTTCGTIAYVTITEPIAISVSINSNNPLCNGNFDGSATVIAIGGSGGYTYQWNGATGALTSTTAVNLGANVLYCVTVTDGNFCQDSACVILTEPTAVSLNISSTTHVSCFNLCDGSATVAGSGGSSPYVYLWPMGNTTATVTGLCAGAYSPTVIDNNGCYAVSTITITQPPALNITFSAPDTICSGTTTAITVMPTGGTPGYSYLWYNASVTNTITGISSGNHCVTVQDASGCSATACKQINTSNFETTIQDNWAGENPHIFMGDVYNIQTTSSHPVLTYNWTPAAGLSCNNCSNPMAAPAVTTTYYLTTLNTIGCIDEDTITIEVFTPNTNHIYIDVAPDSTVQYGYTPSALWTNGSVFNMAILLPPTLNYGVATVDTNIHQVQYVSNGTAPEVTDTVMYLICNQICDTMFFYITTASCVWAGDTDDDGIANNMDLLPIGLHHSATGSTRYNASTDYICQPSRNWNIGTMGNPTVDIKNIDCDGNGVINDIDTNAIVLNWAQTHVKNLSTSTTGIEIYIDTLTASPGDDISLPIILGDVANPSNGYGIAFTIHYDVMGVDTNSVSIDFSNSWLGMIGSNMIGIHKDFYTSGQVEVAMTRTDHNSILGGGTIGYIDLTIKDDVLPKSAFVRLDFEITDVRFIDHLGDTIPTLPLPSQILIVDNWLNGSTIENSNKINVFPNPTGSLLNIQSLNENIEMIQVLDMTGKMLLEQANISDLQTVLDLNILPVGMYILTVQTATAVQTVRVVKN